ncbi:RluA family pseudouridine synthase [candidate division WWE3 bacterium]|uniref:Pseudouridine synthase n=1 Tax=candidate division WWE3 bacterium TaxID=2053526 RepID=A0A955LKS5_UNCKA|nr:RluA family pseudouridine synthase [candidate division WWE3 bacterium]
MEDHFSRIDVLFENDEVLVIDKPEGLVVTPGAKYDEGDTLVGWLIGRVGEQLREVGNEAHRPGIVHRLDKDTSGVMITAKKQSAFEHLISEFKSRKVEKSYMAVVWGDVLAKVPSGEFVVDAPIARNPRNRMRFAVVEDGKPARTSFSVTDVSDIGEHELSLLDCELHTGRTHQIRVHLKSMGFSVLGDPLYQGRGERELFGELVQNGLKRRMYLHSNRLGIRLPGGGSTECFVAPIPPEFAAIQSRL